QHGSPGNRPLPQPRRPARAEFHPRILLRRQIPKEVRMSQSPHAKDEEKPYDQEIDIHVATPYGVTGHLAIPAAKPEKPATPPTTPGFGWDPAKYTVEYESSVDAAGKLFFKVLHIVSDKNEVVINAPALARFRGRGKLHAVVTIDADGPDGTVIQHRVDGSFDIEGVPFDAKKQQFYIVGANLRSFDENLIDVFHRLLEANPELAKSKRGFTVNVGGRLDVEGTTEPIAGKFTATFSKKNRSHGAN
ncbi:MAG: hypothetical protein WD875_10025, partial [Pirellulales bacterium]